MPLLHSFFGIGLTSFPNFNNIPKVAKRSLNWAQRTAALSAACHHVPQLRDAPYLISHWPTTSPLTRVTT